jgi:penicillin-binding protein 2
MNRMQIDKKLYKKILHKPIVKNRGIGNGKGKNKLLYKLLYNQEDSIEISGWNFIYAFVLFVLIFSVLIFSIADLQIIQGEEMLQRSENNRVRLTPVKAYRGVIFDSNGNKLVENVPSVNVSISLESFFQEEGSIDNGEIETVLNTLEGILGNNWDSVDTNDIEYSSLSDRFFSMYQGNPYTNRILLATDVENDLVIKIKARSEDLKGVTIDNGSKRKYVGGDIFSHILGYTGEASSEDLERFSDLRSGDIVGKNGIERYYEEKFHGIDGKLVEEIDVFGRTISEKPYLLSEAVSGQNLYLTIDHNVQQKFYEIIKNSVKEYSAVGGAGIIQDINTGEILAIVSYPSYDNNLFVGGISQTDFNKLLENKRNPLLNRAIAAQIPPGSTFKTIVAIAGLDSGTININTKYLSKRGYTFSNGAPFQEFRNNAYGSLNVVDALMVSSNIFFCEMIRDWEISELVPYLEAFGIGQYTGIDIPGEGLGRVPSPENKLKLSQTISPWLEPVWYPEGDSCNAVIGQGITLVTPIQMSNWMAAIANGGTLLMPHVAKKFVDEDGFEYPVEYPSLKENIASKGAIENVRKGMWKVVNGDRGVAKSLSTTGTSVAAKTGTAEFGELSKDGTYENTHAWVGGFFPYERPQYSFVVFLEDGGSSANATAVMGEMITWIVENGFVK